jgi:phosphoglycolate phosphatase-like HAD superfamily hydrolase
VPEVGSPQDRCRRYLLECPPPRNTILLRVAIKLSSHLLFRVTIPILRRGMISILRQVRPGPVFAVGEAGIALVIILDFDGVVLESVGVKTRAFRELFSFSPEHVDEIVDYHRRNTGVSRFDKFRFIYQEILKEPLSDEQFAWLSERYADLVVDEVVSSPFVPGGREFLERYSAMVPLFVVSASPQEELVSIIRRRGLSSYFRKVYGAPTRKEQAIREILGGTGSAPARTLFVGDALNDLKAARDCGIRFVGRQPPEDPDRFTGQEGVESVVRDLIDLSRLLEGEAC